MSPQRMTMAMIVLLLSGHAVDAARIKKTAVRQSVHRANTAAAEAAHTVLSADHRLHATAPAGDPEKRALQEALKKAADLGELEDTAIYGETGATAFKALSDALKKFGKDDSAAFEEVMGLSENIQLAPNVGKFIFHLAFQKHIYAGLLKQAYLKLKEQWDEDLLLEKAESFIHQLTGASKTQFAKVEKVFKIMLAGEEVVPQEETPGASAVGDVPGPPVTGVATSQGGAVAVAPKAPVIDVEASDEAVQKEQAEAERLEKLEQERARIALRDLLERLDAHIPETATDKTLADKLREGNLSEDELGRIFATVLEYIKRINAGSKEMNMANHGEDVFGYLCNVCWKIVHIDSKPGHHGHGLLEQNVANAPDVWKFLIAYWPYDWPSRRQSSSRLAKLAMILLNNNRWQQTIFSADVISQWRSLDPEFKKKWLLLVKLPEVRQRLQDAMFEGTAPVAVTEPDPDSRALVEAARDARHILESVQQLPQVIAPPKLREDFKKSEIVQWKRSSGAWVFAVVSEQQNGWGPKELQYFGVEDGRLRQSQPTAEQQSSLELHLRKAFFEREPVEVINTDGTVFRGLIVSDTDTDKPYHWRVKYYTVAGPSLRVEKKQSLEFIQKQPANPWAPMGLWKVFTPGGNDVFVLDQDSNQWLYGRITEYLSLEKPGVRVYVSYRTYYSGLLNVHYSDANAWTRLEKVSEWQTVDGGRFMLGNAVAVWSASAKKWCGGFISMVDHSEKKLVVDYIRSPKDYPETSKPVNFGDLKILKNEIDRERIPASGEGKPPAQGIEIFAKHWKAGRTLDFFTSQSIPDVWMRMAKRVAAYKTQEPRQQFLMMYRLVHHMEGTPPSLMKNENRGFVAKRLEEYSRLEIQET